jgi:hypothetical protein
MRRPLTATILTADGYLGVAAPGTSQYPKAAVRVIIIPKAGRLVLKDGGSGGVTKFDATAATLNSLVVTFAPDYLHFDTDCYADITGAGSYCIYTG